jgi:hypothetical protein
MNLAMKTIRCRLFGVAVRVACGLPPIATLKSDAVRVVKRDAEKKFPGVARLASAECE